MNHSEPSLSPTARVRRGTVRLLSGATVLALALALATATSTAGDWMQFRGPLGNGVSTEPSLPTTLDARSVSWKSSLPGRGLSSPIIVGNRVFVTCSSGPRQERLHVLCFNADTGAKLWERQFWATGRTIVHEKTAVAAPTPTSDGERIFAFFSTNDLVCLDLDGNLLWLRGLTHDHPSASNSLGMSSSLVTTDGVVIAMVENDTDSFTAGIDVRTGTNRWRIQRPRKANWTSPFLLQAPNAPTLVALQSSAGITAVEPRTGRVVWDYTDGASTIPTSTLSDGVIYAASRGITALQPAGDGQPPRQLWRSAQLKTSTPSPIVLKNRVFLLNDAGVLTCASTADGSRIWQLRLTGPYSATPVAAGSLLYCVNEAGLLQIVDTLAPEGAVVGQLDLAQVILCTPSIARGALFLRSDATLWKVGKS